MAVVMIAVNTTWNLVNFRSGLIAGLLNAGHRVLAVAPPDKYIPELKKLGCRFIPLPMDNKGTNPGKDLVLFWRFYQLLSRECPDVFLGYTVKPNVYGSIAAHRLGIPVINNIAGLGSVFTESSWITGVVKFLYKRALSRSSRIFFQNEDDRVLFVSSGLVSFGITDRLPGSGVDLDKFVPQALPNGDRVRFLLVARMLWDKGIAEFVQAARLLRQRGVQAELCLLGFLDVQNPSAISRRQMDEWVDEGVINYLGVSDNVSDVIATADCVVLPSFYREGVPRTLLEAAAMARPIVTTDSVGCREVVDDGVNGYLCKPKDAVDLAEKLQKIIDLGQAGLTQMGVLSRKKVEQEFDEQIVIDKYLKAIDGILAT
jgi:glycosyltransferase involved in cell wall biosynthesis